IVTVRAEDGDSPAKMAARAGVDLPMFLKWNDMRAGDTTTPGKLYLLGKKRSRATEAYHKVASGETLWDISQHYGVQLRKLRRYNRMSSDEQITPGMTLWLSAIRPKGAGKMDVVAEVVEVSRGETFAWTADTDAAPAAIPETTASTEPILIAPPAEVTPEKIDSVEVILEDTVNARLADVATPDTVIVAIPSEAGEIVVVPEKKGVHVVQPGETLYAIAKEHSVGVMDLVTWNSLNLQDGIRPGQVLQLSSNQSVNGEIVTSREAVEIQHEVKPTDTLYSIARKYNVTIKDLMAWNNKKDFALAVGEKLKVIQK
ncbi:MAG TPA: LysM peptidoglycan-binding domain-containing protein, partial [Ohtaekwangia sp.]|nr:LysM peptidoglycan-binding domain-containing protein [Ohtaekwangia sp.]